MNRRATPIEWLVFLALGAAWGSSYLFIKIGVETLTPFTLVAGRLAIGAAVLAVVMRLARASLPRQRGVYGHMVVVALLGIVIPFSLITWGEQTIDSGLAAVLNGTVPLFAIVLAALVLPDEPITVNRLGGLLVGFAGVVLLTAPALEDGFGGGLPGQLALLGASISYGAAGVYARRTVRGLPALTSAFLEVGFAFVIVLALAAAFGAPWATNVDAGTILSVAWLGLIGSGLAFLAFFFLLDRWGATRTSLVAYLLPLVGIILGVLVLREVITLPMLAGTALVIGGIALANSRYGHRRLAGRRLPEAVEVPAEVPARD
ncbi:MAG TPA: DMT family transporter [Candidatus Limnocylindria bacterium]|jgi:drug/metabolite transporter (DMT)-like permease